MNLAVIPARGGSKRIPRKNIREFCGRPMIAYAIAAAQESGLFDEVVVSSDDPEILGISRSLGASTPFIRPPELSDDHTPTVPVVAHAIRECRELGWGVEAACCIYPCVPFIRSSDLAGAYALFRESGADYCFPVTEFPSAVQRALLRLPDGRMTPLYPEFETARTQDLPAAYHDAGQFYWGTTLAWSRNPRIHNGGTGFPIPGWRVVDIDTPEDWRRAELLLSAMTGAGSGDQTVPE